MTTNRASLARQLNEVVELARKQSVETAKHFRHCCLPDEAQSLFSDAGWLIGKLEDLQRSFQDYNHPQGVVIRPEIASKGPLTSRMEE